MLKCSGRYKKKQNPYNMYRVDIWVGVVGVIYDFVNAIHTYKKLKKNSFRNTTAHKQTYTLVFVHM